MRRAKTLEYKVTNSDLKDVTTRTLLDLEDVYEQHKKQCYEVLVYMTKVIHKHEAIDEAGKSLDRAILDTYHISEELITRRLKEYVR